MSLCWQHILEAIIPPWYHCTLCLYWIMKKSKLDALSLWRMGWYHLVAPCPKRKCVQCWISISLVSSVFVASHSAGHSWRLVVTIINIYKHTFHRIRCRQLLLSLSSSRTWNWREWIPGDWTKGTGSFWTILICNGTETTGYKWNTEFSSSEVSQILK